MDNRVREAIWTAHGQRCFYCDCRLLFSEAEIDHFIPESIPQSDLDALIERGVLPNGFDIQSAENLVPACRRDNCDKHDLRFTDRFIAIQIARIAGKAKRARAILVKDRKLWELDKIFRHIQRGVDDGKFSPEEVGDYVGRIRDRPPAAEFLGAGIQPHPPQFLITERALHGLRNAGLPLRKLARLLETSAASGELEVYRPGARGRYVLRLDGERRIHFRVVEDLVILDSVESRSDPGPVR